MKRGLFLVLFFSFIFSSVAVSAIGISPDRTNIKFEPFKEGEFNIIVINTYDENITMAVELEGKLARYFNIEENTSDIEKGGMKRFVITYKFPHEIATPGKNIMKIKVRKVAKKGQGISAVLNVISTVNVEVPYPEKYITYDFSLKSANIGQNLDFKFKVNNKGLKNLFVIRPVVDIYKKDDLENQIRQFKGNVFKIDVDGSVVADFSINSTELGEGEFFVDAHVNFDGFESKHRNLSFGVGYEDVEVYNHTKKVLVGGIREYSVYLKNMWNSLVEDVYLEAYIEDKGKHLTKKFVSHTVNLKPLAIEEVPVFLDITDIPPGKYTVVVDIYYGELVKQEKLTIKIDDGFEITNSMILIFILVLLVAIDIAWMVAEGRIKSKKPKHKSEDKLDKLTNEVKKNE
jgi:hypothetical protein